MSKISELEKKIGYAFKDKKLIETALTHSSFSNEYKGGAESYERLEFLGDSILGFITANYLFNTYKNVSEGDLTKLRAALVCERSLHGFSKELNIGEYLHFSYGEEHSGGRERPSILADAFEALTAAIYLDSGKLSEAERFVMRFITPAAESQKEKPFKDYKTMLQEIVQQNPEEKLSYAVTDEKGPDHDKHFAVEVRLNRNVIGKGGGKSKKEAEQQAAREALKLMGY